MPLLSNNQIHLVTLHNELASALAATYEQDGRAHHDAQSSHYSDMIGAYSTQYASFADLKAAHPYVEGTPEIAVPEHFAQVVVQTITEHQASNIIKLQVMLGYRWTKFAAVPADMPVAEMPAAMFERVMKSMLSAAGIRS